MKASKSAIVKTKTFQIVSLDNKLVLLLYYKVTSYSGLNMVPFHGGIYFHWHQIIVGGSSAQLPKKYLNNPHKAELDFIRYTKFEQKIGQDQEVPHLHSKQWLKQ